MKRSISGMLMAALCLLLSHVAIAAEEEAKKEAVPTNVVADIWVVWLKPGAREDFAKALKEHVAWRKKAGDPFKWEVYTPVIGNDLNHVVLRSSGHTWADLDAAQAWGEKNEAGKKWQASGGKFAERYEHYISEFDPKHSYWKDNDAYQLFAVHNISILSGKGAQATEALDVIKTVAEKEGWSRSWAVNWETGGAGGMTLVFPYENYAAMKDPEPGFAKVMGKYLGSESAARSVFKRFNSAVKWENQTVYRYRKEWSTPE